MDQQSRGGPRVAFFGGSFDPPHLGHLGVARAARAALGLDTVLFAPVGTQPLKPRGPVAGFQDRLAMTRLAIAAEPGFALSLADAPKSSGVPNYTLETLAALRAQMPPGSDLFCLMGADSFAGFNRWHRAAEIPFVAPLIVASRPSESLDKLDSSLPEGLSLETEGGGGFNPRVTPTEPPWALAPEVRFSEKEIALRRYILRNPAGQQAPFYLLPGLHIEISASDIRDQIRALAPARSPYPALLPAPVLEYIRAHNLYR
jgi:nicotinate-nucleotide adenylyltransferase